MRRIAGGWLAGVLWVVLAVACAGDGPGGPGGPTTTTPPDGPLPAGCVEPPYRMVVRGGELGSDDFEVVSVAGFRTEAFGLTPAYAVFLADHEMTADELPSGSLLIPPEVTGPGIRAHVVVSSPDGEPLEEGQTLEPGTSPQGLLIVTASVFAQGRGPGENAFNAEEGSVTILALRDDEICLQVDYSTVLGDEPNVVIRGTILAPLRDPADAA